MKLRYGHCPLCDRDVGQVDQDFNNCPFCGHHIAFHDVYIGECETGMQFEYATDTWVYDPEGSAAMNKLRYVNRPRKSFCTVLETFTHHYTGERMCRIRREWVGEDDYPMADELIVKEAAVMKLYMERDLPRETEHIYDNHPGFREFSSFFYGRS